MSRIRRALSSAVTACLFLLTLALAAPALAAPASAPMPPRDARTAASASATLSVVIDGVGTVRSTPAGIDCSASCSAGFAVDTVVLLAATPPSGFSFAGWSGACSGTGPCQLRLDTARQVVARFVRQAPAVHLLSVSVQGSGSVASSPAGIRCGSLCTASFTQGTLVRLSATPAAGMRLAGWSGACSGSALSCTVTMSQARSVAAQFAAPSAAGVIPLTLAEAPAAAAVPVRSGIPFPRGALASLTALRLETAEGGAEVPAQFDLLASWPDGSVKAVLLQFVADAGAARAYRLAYGGGVTRGPVAAPVVVSQSAGSTTVDTRAIRFAIDPRGLLSALWRDANRNGGYEAGEQVLGGGDFFMVNAFDNQEYTASRATSPVITVEEQGPIRAVVRARGALTNAAGATLIKYSVRYAAYAGSDKLDIEFTVTDDRPEANVQSPGSTLALAARGYGLRWAYLADGAAQYRFGLDQGGVASGSVSGEHHLLQSGSFQFVNGEDQSHLFAHTGVGSGLRAPGWVALDSGNRHLALMLRDFWQQYPAELNIKGNILTAALFAERSINGAADTTVKAQSGSTYQRPNTFYFHRPGGAKTHQLRFAFGDALPGTAQLAGLNTGFQRHRLELTAPVAWYAGSGVFGEIDTASSTASTGYSAVMMQSNYLPSIEQPTPQSAARNDPEDRGTWATQFGWRDYGDRLHPGWALVSNGVRVPSFYNDTHVGSANFFKEFLRTGDQRWFALGDIATRHFADIDVAHGPRQGYWDMSFAGMGQQPAGEVHGSSHNNIDHQVRNLHWGHAHVSGLSDLYLLTGDKRALEVLTKIAGWWKHVAPHFFKTPFVATAQYREAERDFAWPLYAMNEYVRVTGDAAYHQQVAAQLARYLVQWWQTPMNHIGYNPATGVVGNTLIGVNDASQGTGYWTMTRMDNYGTASQATGANPWMAGALLGNLIRFHEADKLMAAAGKGSGIATATMEAMLFQTLNYVVKHGWVASSQYFAYSETMRQYDGGWNHLAYPLAYLNRLYVQRLAAGAVANPQWYDTQPQWGPLASKIHSTHASSKVGTYTNSMGFYGYEMVYPVDFFKLMATP